MEDITYYFILRQRREQDAIYADLFPSFYVTMHAGIAGITTISALHLNWTNTWSSTATGSNLVQGV